MKKIFFYLFLLVFLAGCVKIEEEPVDCTGKGNPPQIELDSDQKKLGDSVLVSIVPYSNYDQYFWKRPDGSKDTFEALYSPYHYLFITSTGFNGENRIAVKNQAVLCSPEDMKFNLTVADYFPGCMLDNKFRLGSNAITTLTKANATISNGDYYIKWNDGNVVINLYFDKKPVETPAAYRFDGTGSLELNGYRLYAYDGNYDYTAVSGVVYTRYESSTNTYTVGFCNLGFKRNSYPYPVVTGSGNLKFED